jgi:hypothetical protein
LKVFSRRRRSLRLLPAVVVDEAVAVAFLVSKQLLCRWLAAEFNTTLVWRILVPGGGTAFGTEYMPVLACRLSFAKELPVLQARDVDCKSIIDDRLCPPAAVLAL